MKVIVLLAACVTFCYGHTIPEHAIPGDNSHFVEGEGHYVWMFNGKGKPVLVDREEPVDQELLSTRTGADNKYWLFTRLNPLNEQVLVHGNANSIFNSNYRANRPLFVVVHGWDSDGTDDMNPVITSNILAVQDANVIILDWSHVASDDHATASAKVPNVGQSLGNFLTWLINTAGGNWNQVHLIGLSLGAHVVGNAGRQAGGRPARVTGLDPSSRNWNNNNNAISPNDGQYVECIHTSRSGIRTPSGHADFYPNGGLGQPGCSPIGNFCSNVRAQELFAATVRYNHLVGRRCTNIAEAQAVNCSGDTLLMGNADMNKRGSGIYGLKTAGFWPY